MLRWFKKKSSKNGRDKNGAPTTNKDEYGFDPVRKCSSSNVLFIRNVEHIYEEIADVPPRGEKKVSIPDLPPRNSTRRSKRTGTSYSQWRFASLSRKSRSLPELQDPTETGITVVDVHQQKSHENSARKHKHPVERTTHPDAHSVILPKQAHIRVLRKSTGISYGDSLDDFDEDRTSCYPRSDYLPGSDSGYDYSGTSSNGSDVNDSGIASSYEFHLSKAEQLRRMEQEVQDLAIDVSSVHVVSRDLDIRSGKYRRRNPRKNDSGIIRDLSIASSSSRTSVTSDLDMDDETLAYGERSDFTFLEELAKFENDFSANRLSVRAMPVSRASSKTLPSSSRSSRSGSQSGNLSRHSTQSQSTRPGTTKEGIVSSSKGKECRNVKCKNKHLKLSPQKSASIGRCSGQTMSGEVTQRYQRPSNRLLGDLIRRNNDTLFFV